jgi:hypothetical protein
MKKREPCTTCGRPIVSSDRGPTAKHVGAADLTAYSYEHLDYEIGMLVASVKAWPTNHVYPVGNALTEAFAIHLRNLIAFLYPGREVCGDVSARDFMDAPEIWEKAAPPISAVLQLARTRAHREIAHLTVDRIPGSEKGKEWDPALVDVLLIPLRKFVDQADEKLDQRVKARVVELESARKAKRLPIDQLNMPSTSR